MKYALIIVFGLSMWVGGPWLHAAQERASFTDRYGSIVENNIFLRDRGRSSSPGPSGPTSRPAPAPLAPEQALMLTGIVLEDGEYRAYFENLTGGSPLRVTPGDPIARGTVADIALNAVAYRGEDGTIQWVEIGQDLTGAEALVSARPSPAPRPAGTDDASGASASTPPSDDVDPSTLSARERMMRRRQEALNRN